MTIFTAGATLRPVAVGSRAQLVALVHAVGTHRIRPVLDRVFPFDDAPEAFRQHLGGTALGKVVITAAANHERI
jgi:NADPH:quinone reductase-like Zn-dependent oxidoreductase